VIPPPQGINYKIPNDIYYYKKKKKKKKKKIEKKKKKKKKGSFKGNNMESKYFIILWTMKIKVFI